MNKTSDREKLLLLRKRLKSERKKLSRKRIKQESELEIAGKWLWYQQMGDSLLSDPSKCVKGTSELELLNIHTNETEKVKCNPKLDAVKNADLFYRKAKKGKRGVETCENQLENTINEVKKVENLIEQCYACLQLDEDSDDFNSLFNSIVADFEENYQKDAVPTDKKGRELPKVPYRHYTINGWQVYIGKNTTQNDELSTKFAKPRDIWLHVAAHSGSHCVIKREKNQEWPPKEVLEKVSALAVWFSKAKHTSYAEVHVCEARFVRKPRKSPPGEVVIQQYKTIRVAPISPQEMFRE